MIALMEPLRSVDYGISEESCELVQSDAMTYVNPITCNKALRDDNGYLSVMNDA